MQSYSHIRLGFIGGGHMATALIGGCYQQFAIAVSEPDADKRQHLNTAFNAEVLDDNAELVKTSDIVVLAVKPQHVQAVARSLHNPRVTPKILVSIAAGIDCQALANGFGDTTAIVRAMPNTPALIGEGITGLFANALVGEMPRALINQCFAGVGQTLWFDQEDALHAVTAVSGSGPAYVFWLIERMVQAGVNAGLSADQSHTLALQTVKGASLLAASSELSPAKLREQVSSKGGTTEAALDYLKKHNIAEAFEQAIKQAHDRSLSLNT